MNTVGEVNKESSEVPVASPRRVIVCAGTGCMANGSLKVFQAMKQEMAAAGLNVILEFRPEANGDGIRVSESGCQGFCQMGPLVTVLPEGILYTKVKPDDAKEIVETDTGQPPSGRPPSLSGPANPQALQRAVRYSLLPAADPLCA